MNSKNNLFLILLMLLFSCSCNNNRLDIQLTNSPVSIHFENVDTQMKTASKKQIRENIGKFEKELGNLFLYEMSENLRINIDTNDSSYLAVYQFYQSEYIQDLEKEKQKLSIALPQHQKKINLAFQYLSYYFGEEILPKHIFYINKLFSSIKCSDESISVGLENYISPESTVIKSLPGNQLYEWQRTRMDIQYLERDVLLAWIQAHLFKEIEGNLAEHFIQAGKILYILNAVFPKEDEAYILRYSDHQYQWAKENEESVWNYLVKEQMLFKTDLGIRTNFLNEGPMTMGLADNSPDRMGQFIGYQIVKKFMEKNKTLSLPKLLEAKYNLILQTYEIR